MSECTLKKYQVVKKENGRFKLVYDNVVVCASSLKTEDNVYLVKTPDGWVLTQPIRLDDLTYILNNLLGGCRKPKIDIKVVGSCVGTSWCYGKLVIVCEGEGGKKYEIISNDTFIC